MPKGSPALSLALATRFICKSRGKGKHEKQLDHSGFGGGTGVSWRRERCGTIVQSNPLDQERPDGQRAACGKWRAEQEAGVEAAGGFAAAHEVGRCLRFLPSVERLRRGAARQPQS